MNILAIETSCDETAVSVGHIDGKDCEILSNIVSSQVKLHARWGGVVPNLAAREHLKNIPLVLREALEKANVTPDNIDLLAVTQGPGLIPALMIGVTAARTLSYLWQKPLIGIHHIEGHIYANFISNEIGVSFNNQFSNTKQFPILCLVVSGGHTQLVLMKNHLHYEIVGETLDDAAGEAFDKVARILKLGYPGGPAISAAADKFKIQNPKSETNPKIQNAKYKMLDTVNLPRPMINSKDFNFSFSGLKTAVLYETKKNAELLNDKNYVNALAHEFQESVADVLVQKTIKAAKKYNPQTIILAGGVSANSKLREQMEKAIQKYIPDTKYQILNTRYCGDNAAMIACAAGFRWQKMSPSEREKALENWRTLSADANLKLTSLDF